MKILSLFVAMMISNIALASVSVYDHVGVLTQAEQGSLIANGSRWPFDLHVLIGTYPNPAALNSAVHNCVNSPNVVCIGLDPSHHKTNVHFGTAVGVPASEYASIVSAGNSYFRDANYQGGIEAIATRTRTVAHSVSSPVTYNQDVTHTVIQQPVQVHVDSTGTSAGWWFFSFFMLLIVGACIWAVSKSRKTVQKINSDMNDFRDEAFEMSSRNMEERDWHEKMKAKQTVDQHPMMPTKTVASLPAPSKQVIVQPVVQSVQSVVAAPVTPSTTVIHNHISGGGSGYSGSGVTDVLLGYELGRITAPTPVYNPPVVIEREVIREPAPSYDNGGSSSSWNNNNSSDDAGGSSSNWNNNDSSNDDSSSSSNDSSWGNSDSGSSDSGWDSGSSDSGSSDSGGGDSGGDY